MQWHGSASEPTLRPAEQQQQFRFPVIGQQQAAPSVPQHPVVVAWRDDSWPNSANGTNARIRSIMRLRILRCAAIFHRELATEQRYNPFYHAGSKSYHAGSE